MAKSEATFTEEAIEDGMIMTVEGEIDFANSPDMRLHLKHAAAKEPKRLVVNLAGVPYMDSSGVATLVEVLQAQRAHKGRVVLCCMQAKVKGIFEIARLDTVFEITDDVETAKTC